MITKKDIYGGRTSPTPNTFIGGVASSLSTKNLLAAKLGISPTRIKSFRIVNDEVQAYLEGNYFIGASVWLNNSELTHYHDIDGLITGTALNAIRNCTNLTSIIFPKCTILGLSCFYNCVKLATVILPELIEVGTSSLQNCNLLTSLDLPKVAYVGPFGLANNPLLAYINLPSLVNLGGSVLNNSVFQNIKVGCVVNVPMALMIVNAGLPDGDLSIPNLDVNYIGYTPVPANYNTVIGGLSAIYDTRYKIGNKLGIGSARIIDFSIDGADIRFRVLGAYALGAVFNGDTNITYYKDNAGLCSQLNNNAFSFATNLTEAYFPATTTLNAGTSGTSGVFNDCPKLTIIHMPLLTNINGRKNFANTPSLKFMNFDNIIGAIGVWTFQGSGIEHISLPLVTSLGQEMLSVNTLTKIFDAPVATDFAIRVFENARGLEIINIPSVENIPVKNQTFHDLTSLNILNAKKLKYIGNPGSVNGNGSAPMFNSLKLNCRIQVHIDMATVNSGFPDTSLIWAKTNRSAIVEFYDDSGNYVSTL